MTQMPLLNIYYGTYRSDVQAKLNLINLIEAVKIFDDTILTIGYGGNQSEHYRWIESRAKEVIQSRIYTLNDCSVRNRYNWSLNHLSDWVFFVSDDDPFSSNYIVEMIETIRSAHPAAISVRPTYYLINNENEVKIHSSLIYPEPELHRKITAILDDAETGIYYYGAHRYEVVRSIFSETRLKSGFLPSYLDQVLVFYSGVRGDILLTKNPTVLVYDRSNWTSPQRAVLSDLRSYASKISIFIHEIYWLREYLDCLIGIHLDDESLRLMRDYSLVRLSWAIKMFDARIEACPEVSANLLSELKGAIFNILLSLNSESNFAELRAAIDPGVFTTYKTDVYAR